ncbi:MAG: F0F1 ATP synthase subunit A [Planctomycetota bacterium]|nr:F0F1 ATP synthase subunit A [Planctomycetota bacterium]
MLAPRVFLLVLFGLLAVLGTAPLALAQGEGESGQAGQKPAQKYTLEMEAGEVFRPLHGHSVPHQVWGSEEQGTAAWWFAFYWENMWQVISLVVVMVIMLGVAGSFRKDGRPGWLVRVFRGWCRWVRDEMVYSVMGEKEGKAWVPYFLFVFFFVTGMNVLGMLPSIKGVLNVSASTGTPYVTGPLALITFVLMLVCGMRKNGVLGFIKGLMPAGLPVALMPMMLLIELVGLIIKPFALMVRLFANMLAGHLVIASMIGLIFVFTQMIVGKDYSPNTHSAFWTWLSYAPALLAAGMAAFMFILESFVTLLQGYIFTYLSIIFIHQAIHQEH